jgi:hypothetical protein
MGKVGVFTSAWCAARPRKTVNRSVNRVPETVNRAASKRESEHDGQRESVNRAQVGRAITVHRRWAEFEIHDTWDMSQNYVMQYNLI